MGRKIKLFFYSFCGVLALSIFLCHDSFAIDYDTSKLGSYLFVPKESYALKSDGSYIYFTDNGNGMEFSTILNVIEVHLKFDRVIPENSMVNFFLYASGDANQSSMVIKAYGGKAYIYETQFVNWISNPLNPGNITPGNPLYSGAGDTNVKFITTQDVDELIIALTPQPTGYFGITPGSYIGLVNTSQDMKDLQGSVEQGNQQQQDRWDKEDEQRKQDEEKANQAGSDSKDSSDSSQSDVDEASSSLFDVLNSMKDSIAGGSAGTCNISGDFGLFDAGTINLCTGNSAVRAITTVVGNVMLFFLLFKAVLVIIDNFMQLYNDSFK